MVKPKRPDIEVFKENLIKLLGQIDEKESEENVKIHLMDFLKDTWYKQNHLVATKSRTDFVIHTGNLITKYFESRPIRIVFNESILFLPICFSLFKKPLIVNKSLLISASFKKMKYTIKKKK